MSVETEDSIRGEVLRIPLTRGLFATIDTTDWHLVAGDNWYARKAGKTFYASRITPRPHRTCEAMHARLMGRKVIDHINGDGLNNRRNNLRHCNGSQNQSNRRSAANARLPYKGVSMKAEGLAQPYRATLTSLNRQIHLGYFANPLAAALAYDSAALKYHGDFARVNFP